MEAWQSLLGDNPNKVLSSFSDESEQEISDHHISKLSSEEIMEEDGISSDSDDSHSEVYSSSMFSVCLFAYERSFFTFLSLFFTFRVFGFLLL